MNHLFKSHGIVATSGKLYEYNENEKPSCDKRKQTTLNFEAQPPERKRKLGDEQCTSYEHDHDSELDLCDNIAEKEINASSTTEPEENEIDNENHGVLYKKLSKILHYIIHF